MPCVVVLWPAAQPLFCPSRARCSRRAEDSPTLALAWTLFAAICRVAQAFESVYKALHKRPLLRRRSVLAVEVGRGGEEDEQLVLPASALPAPAMFSGGAAGTPSAAQRTTRRSTRAARATSALSGASTPLVASPPPPGLAQQQQQRTLGANLAVASKALSSATPSRRTRSVAAGSDAGSRASMLMDVDEAAQSQQPQQGKDTDRLLVKDESYAIAERKGLPVEVQEAIAASGASASPFSCCRAELTPCSTCCNRPVHAPRQGRPRPDHRLRPPRQLRPLLRVELGERASLLALLPPRRWNRS